MTLSALGLLKTSSAQNQATGALKWQTKALLGWSLLYFLHPVLVQVSCFSY
jgi:hypothetical protein